MTRRPVTFLCRYGDTETTCRACGTRVPNTWQGRCGHVDWHIAQSAEIYADPEDDQ